MVRNTSFRHVVYIKSTAAPSLIINTILAAIPLLDSREAFILCIGFPSPVSVLNPRFGPKLVSMHMISINDDHIYRKMDDEVQ